jgi:hypothetical protein
MSWHDCSPVAYIVGTVLSYIFYWLAVIAVLVYLKYKEVGSTAVLCWPSTTTEGNFDRGEPHSLVADQLLTTVVLP